ncbi:unnamed protein product [Durusdinium trenchii]|uniref:Uncharacterized protein n=2 Tax=Durusdinium trenchii TaxID=1381693 RepID=A0ABP0KFL1_9DINO
MLLGCLIATLGLVLGCEEEFLMQTQLLQVKTELLPKESSNVTVHFYHRHLEQWRTGPVDKIVKALEWVKNFSEIRLDIRDRENHSVDLEHMESGKTYTIHGTDPPGDA